MTGSEFAANVIFAAGWVAVGAAAMYTRRRNAARQAEAEGVRATAASEEPLVCAAPRNPHRETVWSSDLAALANAIENATPTPEQEREYSPAAVAAKPKADNLQRRRKD
jgi:hypothetical protein